MSAIVFEFATGANTAQFSMNKACLNPSNNPVPAPTPPCIYVINNQNTAPPSVYVGYAADAQHRWATRTEAFHVFNIPAPYGKNIKCGWCVPQITTQAFGGNVGNINFANPALWNNVPLGHLQGADAAEHLLIRCVVNGVLGGGIVSTNTQLGSTPFDRSTCFPGLTHVLVYFGTKFTLPLGNRRYAAIANNAY